MTEYFTVERNPELIDRKVIEDIKQEIIDTVCEESNEGEQDWCAGLGYALKIIDKHTKGECG